MNVVVVALEDELPYELPPGFTKLVTGVGKVNATYTLTEALSKTIGIQSVINYGSAGGLTALKGELVEIDYFVERDMDCQALGCGKYITFGEYEANAYTFNHGKQKKYICGTGDSFSEPNDDYQLVDMEGYALAKVCWRFHVPFYAYKYVSDDGDASDWNENLHKGAEKFKKILKKF